MLTPEYLGSVPDPLVELYALVESDIIANMAKRISAQDFFIPAAEWQMKKLEAMGMVREEIVKRLSAETGKTEAELKRIIRISGIETLKSDDEVYRRAGLSPPPLSASIALQQTIEAGYQKTLKEFRNLTATTANTATKQFEDALDQSWLRVVSGGFAPEESIRMAVKSLAEKGMAMVKYPTGHIDYTDVAVRRATLTGVNQTCSILQEDRADEMESDLVEVTAHAGARPSHAEWQGKIYSRSGNSDKYPPLKESTGYGTGPGLCGWNCRHNFYPYFEGISNPAYTEKDLAAMEAKTYTYNGKKMTEYEAVSRQREIERKLRKWKREKQAMEAAGLSSDEASSKIACWNKVQEDYLKQTGLKRQYDREKVYGNAGISANGVNRHYEKGNRHDIIYTREKFKPGTHKVSQKQIDDIVSEDLTGIKLSARPVYNPRIRTPGKTIFELYPWGEVKRVKSVEIGKQVSADKWELIDTLLHEEMEARIFTRPTRLHKKLADVGKDDEIHAYIDRVLDRYKRMRGVK